MKQYEGDVEIAHNYMTRGPIKRGDVYRHYKGNLYVVLGKAIKEDDLTEMVVYKSLIDGRVWTRPRSEWSSHVESSSEYLAGPRFEWTGVHLDLGEM